MISASSDDWMEVGSGGRTSFARSMAHQQSPISMIIYGQYRSVIHKSRCKDSITMEPFHCIALDIKASGINTLQDAIAAMVLPEIVSSNLATVSLPDMNIGASKISYFKGKTIPSAVGINHHQHGIPFNRNSNIDLITKTTTIHQAPPILFIQLKRFDYNQITHNITKNKKTIKIPIRFDLASKAYRLHSIIYHHGGGATGGHYTSHVQVDRPFDSKATLNINHSRAFQSKWYHFNDNIISEEGGEAILDVFQNDERRSPYLLAYIAY